MKRNASMILTVFLFIAALMQTVSGDTERTLPAGTTALTEIIEVTASETTLIPAVWSSSSITVLQANGVTEDFRAAIGTSTIDTDLPLLDNFSVSFRSGGFVSIQTASDTAKFVVYHVKE